MRDFPRGCDGAMAEECSEKAEISGLRAGASTHKTESLQARSQELLVGVNIN